MVIAQDGAPVRAEVPASLDSGTLFTLRIVREVVERVNPASFDRGITWGFAGDLQTDRKSVV